MSAPSPPIISNSIPRSGPGTLEFWWDPPATGTVTSYRIQSFALSIDESYSYTANSAFFSGIPNNISYQFQITASNAFGESTPALWPLWEAGIPSGPPTSVNANFTAEPSIVVVSVTPPVTSNILQYYYAKGTPINQVNSNDYIEGTQYASNTTIPVQNFNPDRAYRFSVRANSAQGWSVPSSDDVTYARVSGCFITNAAVLLPFGGIDTNSDQVVLLTPRVADVPVTLYNRFGAVVQTFSAAETGVDVNIIAYISADGSSNLWMARIISNGLTFFGNYYLNTLFDLNGNIIIPLNIFGNVTFYDKTGATIAALSSPGNLSNNFYGYILKFSPTGIWAGVNDPNTWVGRFIMSGIIPSTNHRTYMQGIFLDANNNIIVSGAATNVSGATQTITVQDQSLTTIGTPITITGTGGITQYTIFVKFASNGLATNSWRAYVTSQFSAQTYITNTTVNKYGQVIAAVRYRDGTPQVFSSDDTVIGGTLPFTSSLAQGLAETVLIRFCSTGVASASWRAPIYSSSIHTFSKNDAPYSVVIDSNDNIYMTGFSEGGIVGATTVPLFVCASNDTTFISTQTLGNNNLFTTKYSNSGQPLWVTLLKGTNTASFFNNTNFTIPTLNNNNGTTPQYLKTFLDNQNNFTLVGVYSRARFDVLNRNQETVFTTPVPGNTLVSSFGATYVVKFVNDGSNAYTSILNTVSTPNLNQTNLPIGNVINGNNELILFQQSMTSVFPAFVNIPIGVYGYNGSSNINASPDLSTFTTNIGVAGYQYIVKFTSSLSTIARAQIQQSNAVLAGIPFGGGTNQAGGYIGLTSTDDVVVSGIYQNSIRVFDFGSDSSSFFLRSTSISNCQGLYVAKLTGTPSNSWVGQTTIAGTVGAPNNVNTLQQKTNTFFNAIPFQVNQSTNQIYSGAQTLSSVYTLFDGYNSSIKTMGFASTNLSNVTFFTSYPSDGRFTLS